MIFPPTQIGWRVVTVVKNAGKKLAIHSCAYHFKIKYGGHEFEWPDDVKFIEKNGYILFRFTKIAICVPHKFKILRFPPLFAFFLVYPPKEHSVKSLHNLMDNSCA